MSDDPAEPKKHPNWGGARPRSGPLPKYGELGHTRKVWVSMPERVLAKVKALATKRGLSFSEFITKLCQRAK